MNIEQNSSKVNTLQNIQIQTKLPFYSICLLLTENRKTFTGISKFTNISYSQITRILKNEFDQKEGLQNQLIDFAKIVFGNSPVTIIIDDTSFKKPHSLTLEETKKIFDSSDKYVTSGYQIITVMITDSIHTLPVTYSIVPTKKSGQEYRKSYIVLEIIKRLITQFNIQLVLGDAHYGTQFLTNELDCMNIEFVFKIAANRVIQLSDTQKNGQIKNVVRCKRNARSVRVKALYANNEYYFYAVKRKNNIIYFISNRLIHSKEIESIYKERWHIEKFHRTIKQSLGFQDCQSTSKQKQEIHILSVFLSYAHIEIERVKRKLHSVEDILRIYRSQKYWG